MSKNKSLSQKPHLPDQPPTLTPQHHPPPPHILGQSTYLPHKHCPIVTPAIPCTQPLFLCEEGICLAFPSLYPLIYYRPKEDELSRVKDMAVGIHFQHPTTGKYSQNGARGGHLPPHTPSAPPTNTTPNSPSRSWGSWAAKTAEQPCTKMVPPHRGWGSCRPKRSQMMPTDGTLLFTFFYNIILF